MEVSSSANWFRGGREFCQNYRRVSAGLISNLTKTKYQFNQGAVVGGDVARESAY